MHLPTVRAVEVVRVVGVAPEHEGLLVDDQVAPLADVLAQALGLLTVVARPAEMPAGGRGIRARPPHSHTARPPPGEESPDPLPLR